jgi:hypothetical protein
LGKLADKTWADAETLAALIEQVPDAKLGGFAWQIRNLVPQSCWCYRTHSLSLGTNCADKEIARE